MTTLISWITYDQNSPASLYIASDSRFSWNESTYWDSGRKVYLSNKYPDIFGFCGDVVFCSQVISQVVSYIDTCDIFKDNTGSDSRFELVYNLIKRSFGHYPTIFALESFQILYGTREKKGEFHVYVVEWSKTKPTNQRWSNRKLQLPSKTGLIGCFGSGSTHYTQHYNGVYMNSDIGGYSRSYYISLYSHINSGHDPRTGGSIQLAGLFNKHGAIAHGVINDGKRYLYGMEVDPHEKINNIRWVNERFENCDGNNIKRYEYAQIQPLPHNLNNPLGKSTRKILLPR
ncbi:hypothetical protein J6836_07475 [Providencia sp. R33]|uniref:hypothetical protein n=1 Tax=Providencia sp. R33 TaxID=2828763 RepID=UPI001C5B8106|nr:hypothetical protein [Providencia sp. R33]QXX84205.1 hypothetical protein J6836_07475 [Providencia sp. R33]